jgi:hypothetical protein
MSVNIKQVQSEEGISDEELNEMVRAAAPVTHENGNRRFHHWLFKVEGDILISMCRWDMVHRDLSHQRKGSDEFLVTEECALCDGDGCKQCGWVGFITAYRSAPKHKISKE